MNNQPENTLETNSAIENHDIGNTSETIPNSDSIGRLANQSHLIESHSGEQVTGRATDYIFTITESLQQLEITVTDTGEIYINNPTINSQTDEELQSLLRTSIAYTEENIGTVDKPVVNTITDIDYSRVGRSIKCYAPMQLENSNKTVYREVRLKIESYLKINSTEFIDPLYCKVNKNASDVDFISTTEHTDETNPIPEFQETPVQFTINNDRTVTIQENTESTTANQRLTKIKDTLFIEPIVLPVVAITMIGTLVLGVFGLMLLSAGVITPTSIVLLASLFVGLSLYLFLLNYDWESNEKSQTPPLELHNDPTTETVAGISTAQINPASTSQSSRIQTVTVTHNSDTIIFTSTTDNTTWKVPLQNGLFPTDLTNLFYDIGYEHLDATATPIDIKITSTKPDDETKTAVQTDNGDWIQTVE